MGWNELQLLRPHPLFAGVAAGAHAYFVHSYHLRPADPADLLAWLGPGIGPGHFEVGAEVRQAFIARDAGAADAFAANARGRWQCDLAGLARRRLAALGIGAVCGGKWCTYADSARFFSYRRDGRCGRMAALIWREE